MKLLHLTLPMVAVLGINGCATDRNTPGTTELQTPATARPAPQLQAKSPAKAKPARTLTEDSPSRQPPVPPDSLSDSTETGLDLWERLGTNIGFAHHVNDELLTQQMKRYAFNQRFFDHTLPQASIYLPYVLEQVLAAGMPAEVALVPFVESGYSPFAYSPSGAAGLWQFIPSTADHLGLKRNQWYDGRRDVITSTEAAIDYLKLLNEKFNGDWLLTLAAYNAGPATVENAIRNHRSGSRNVEFWSLPLRGETQRFVRRIVALSKVVSEPDKYGVALEPLSQVPSFAVIDLKNPVDLSKVAKAADISTDKVYQLNPGFTRWATPPTGSHQLVLPVDSAESFEEKLAALPRQERRSGAVHVVSQGDTLGAIANKHGLTSRQLAVANNIATGQTLRIGQRLQIPAGPTAIRPTQTTAFTTYQVKSGDNLWSIAQARNLSVTDIAAWNKLSQRATLKPGQTLRFYKKGSGDRAGALDYQVQSGDSLSTIAKRHNVAIRDLITWNNLSASSRLLPGQVLKIHP